MAGEVLRLQLARAAQVVGQRGVGPVPQRVQPGPVQAGHLPDEVVIGELGRVDTGVEVRRGDDSLASLGHAPTVARSGPRQTPAGTLGRMKRLWTPAWI